MNQVELPAGKVAVLLATYNGELYIREQLNSLLHQTHQDFCCFMHDDGSTDSTNVILKQYAVEHPTRFILVEAPGCGGAKANFMFLLSSVQADYYMFCDQDDKWHPEKMQVILKAMREAEEKYKLVCVHSDLRLVDSSGQEIWDSYYTFSGKKPQKNSLCDLLKVNTVVGCTMMINRKLRNLALDCCNMDKIFMHDWWIALLAAARGSIIYVPLPLIDYRQHGTNSIGARRKHGFLKRAVRNMNFRGAIKAKKSRQLRMCNFAVELAVILGAQDPNYNFLYKLGNIADEKKWDRIMFYMKNNLFTDESPHLWQMLWI